MGSLLLNGGEDIPKGVNSSTDINMAIDEIQSGARTDFQTRTEKLQSILSEAEYYEHLAFHCFLELGKRWKAIKSERLWAALGYAHSAREFFEKEAKRPYDRVNKVIEVCELFGGLVETLPPGTPPIDPERLIKLLRIFKSKESDEDPEVWLHRVTQCSKKDFDNYMREAKGKQATDTCSHPRDLQETFWRRCKVCNGFHREPHRPSDAERINTDNSCNTGEPNNSVAEGA